MAIQEDALMGPVEFTAEVRDEGGATLVVLAGEVDIASCGALREVLVLPEVLNAPIVRVDLTGVEFLGSPGIGLFVSACKRVRESGGAFSVVCGRDNCRRLLEVAGLIEYLQVRDPT